MALKVITVNLPEFAVIGKEGLCTKSSNIAQKLWEEANSHFAEVASLGIKNADGSYAGFWGAMSDETGSFLPWTDNFSRGLYLAGLEVSPEAVAPEGWTKWIIPARSYLVSEVEPDRYRQVFEKIINEIIPQTGKKLAGAVCDYTNPSTGKSSLYFPVEQEA